MIEARKSESNLANAFKLHGPQRTQTQHQNQNTLLAFKPSKNQNEDLEAEQTLKKNPFKKVLQGVKSPFSKSVSSLLNQDPQKNMMRVNQSPKDILKLNNTNPNSNSTPNSDPSQNTLENFHRQQQKQYLLQQSAKQQQNFPQQQKHQQQIIQQSSEQKIKNTKELELQCTKIKFGDQKQKHKLQQKSKPKQQLTQQQSPHRNIQHLEKPTIAQKTKRIIKHNDSNTSFALLDTNNVNKNISHNNTNISHNNTNIFNHNTNKTNNTTNTIQRNNRFPKSVSYDETGENFKFMQTQTIDRRFISKYQTASEETRRSSEASTRLSDILDFPMGRGVVRKEAFKSKSNLKTFKSESNLKSLSSNRPPQLPPRNYPFKKALIKRVSLLRQDFEFFQLDFSKIDFKHGLISSYAKDYPYLRSIHPTCILSRAGVAVGDYLIEINGRSMEGMSQSRLLEILNQERKFTLKMATLGSTSPTTTPTTATSEISPLLKSKSSEIFSHESHYEEIIIDVDEKDGGRGNDGKGSKGGNGRSAGGAGKEKQTIEKGKGGKERILVDRIDEKETKKWNDRKVEEDWIVLRVKRKEEDDGRWQSEINNNHCIDKSKINNNNKTNNKINNNNIINGRVMMVEEGDVELRRKKHGDEEDSVFVDGGMSAGKKEVVLLNAQQNIDNPIQKNNFRIESFPPNLFLAATNNPTSTTNNTNNINNIPNANNIITTTTLKRVFSSNSSGFVSEENTSDGSVPSCMSTGSFDKAVYPAKTTNKTQDFELGKRYSAELQQNRFSKGPNKLEILEQQLQRQFNQQQSQHVLLPQEIPIQQQQKLQHNSHHTPQHISTHDNQISQQHNTSQQHQKQHILDKPPPLPPKSYTLKKSSNKNKSDYYNRNNLNTKSLIPTNKSYDDIIETKFKDHHEHNISNIFDSCNNGITIKTGNISDQSSPHILSHSSSHPTFHPLNQPLNQPASYPLKQTSDQQLKRPLKHTSPTKSPIIVAFNHHNPFTDHKIIVNVNTPTSKENTNFRGNDFTNIVGPQPLETNGNILFDDFDEEHNNLIFKENGKHKICLKQDFDNGIINDFDTSSNKKYNKEMQKYPKNNDDTNIPQTHSRKSTSDIIINKTHFPPFPHNLASESPTSHQLSPSFEKPILSPKIHHSTLQKPAKMYHSIQPQTPNNHTSTLQSPSYIQNSTQQQSPTSSNLISSTLFLTPPSEFLDLGKIEFEQNKYRKERKFNKFVETSEGINVVNSKINNSPQQDTQHHTQHSTQHSTQHNTQQNTQQTSFTSTNVIVDNNNNNFNFNNNNNNSYNSKNNNNSNNNNNNNPPPLPPRKVKNKPLERENRKIERQDAIEITEINVLKKEMKTNGDDIKSNALKGEEIGLRGMQRVWCVDESEVEKKIIDVGEIREGQEINGAEMRERELEVGKVEEWGEEEVCDWLESISFKRFTSEFKSKKVDGTSLLHLRRHDLVGMGMVSLETRRDFERALLRIKNI